MNEQKNSPSFGKVERNNLDTRKFKVAHPWDARFKGTNPQELIATAKKLVDKLNTKAADYIVGFAEGGLLAAFAVSAASNIPMVGSYRVRCKLDNEIQFTEPHSERPNHYIYALRPGDSVILIEDEITTGITTLNAKKSLQDFGVTVVDVGAFIISDQVRKAQEAQKNDPFHIKYLYCLEA
ncbi:MAG: phosphoribosyltransferase [SAR324 cluster bacterium]|nr:phosphoribosyltransferase [SAR324 cluster bacterium]